jgi:hypothetical protein
MGGKLCKHECGSWKGVTILGWRERKRGFTGSVCILCSMLLFGELPLLLHLY